MANKLPNLATFNCLQYFVKIYYMKIKVLLIRNVLIYIGSPNHFAKQLQRPFYGHISYIDYLYTIMAINNKQA